MLGWLGQSLELQSQSALSLIDKSERILCLNGVQISECTYSLLSREEEILSGQCPAMFLEVRRVLLDSVFPLQLWKGEKPKKRLSRQNFVTCLSS